MPFLESYPSIALIRDMARRRRRPVYLVGGFVRDYLLGRPGLDFDFAVERGAVRFARDFARRLKAAFILLDEEHGCARVVKKSGGQVTTYDFADFRGPSLNDDLKHRDFTVNTLTVCLNDLLPGEPLEKRIKDLRKGRADLKAKQIRMSSKGIFQEDPLRLLRAFSLRAQTGFKIEAGTLKQIRQDKGRLGGVSAERVREEFFKILESPRTAANLRAMDRTGLLEQVIPQLALMRGIGQGGYHHLDVWKHSLETVAQAEKIFKAMSGDAEVSGYLNQTLGGQHTRRALIKFACLVHDVGKPQTLKREAGRLSFHAHERKGKQITRDIARLMKLSTRERYALEDMVLWHLRPGYLSNFKHPSERAIFRYMRDTGEEAAAIALLSLADQRSTRGPMTTEADQHHHETICLDLVRRFFEKKKEKPFVRLLNGDDLIRELKWKPSALFGWVLAEVEEQQVLGKISTRPEALALARQIAAKKMKEE